MDLWEVAKNVAMKLHTTLGITEEQARCFVIPTSDHSYRVTVIRLSDGMIRTVKIEEAKDQLIGLEYQVSKFELECSNCYECIPTGQQVVYNRRDDLYYCSVKCALLDMNDDSAEEIR